MGNNTESDKGKILFGMLDIGSELLEEIETRAKEQFGSSRLGSVVTEVFSTIIDEINLDASISGKPVADILEEFLTAEVIIDEGSFSLHYGLLDFEYDDEDAQNDGFTENPIKKKISIIDIVKNFLEDESWANRKNIFVAFKKDLDYCASLCQKAIESDLEDWEENLDRPLRFEREYGSFVVQDLVAREVDDEDNTHDRA